jgi:hypothetical protein
VLGSALSLTEKEQGIAASLLELKSRFARTLTLIPIHASVASGTNQEPLYD